MVQYAVDEHEYYDGDQWAMKTAGHELKGLLAIIACHIDNLGQPLVAVINYLGFRLVRLKGNKR
jgi:hypothetical protein